MFYGSEIRIIFNPESLNFPLKKNSRFEVRGRQIKWRAIYSEFAVIFKSTKIKLYQWRNQRILYIL
jgi:hypothetical protein